jgi:hypothetical protein
MSTNLEKVFSLIQVIQDSKDLSSSITELKDILAADCAEWDKAKVS